MKAVINKILFCLIFCCVVCFAVSGRNSEETKPETDGEPTENITDENNAESQSNAAQEQQAEPEDGGTLKISMRRATTLNPLTNCEETVDDALKLMFKPLIGIDQSYKAVNSGLAESWEFSEDGLRLTIKLKGGATWDNGAPVTAADVVYSLNVIKGAAENSMYKRCLRNVKSYSAIGDTTVAVDFNAANSFNVYSLSFPVISSKYYAQNSNADFQPVGSGEYRFVSYKNGDALRLTRRNEATRIENIEAIIVEDKEAQKSCFERGLTDAFKIDATRLGSFDSRFKIGVNEYPEGYMDYIGFNFSNSIFADKNARRAVAYLIPKDYFIESAYIGRAKATDTLVNPDYWFYNAQDVQKYPYNPSHARILLEESGWADDDGDGVRERDDENARRLSVRLLVNQENDERMQIARRLKDELKAVGFDVYLDVCDFEQYAQKLAAGDFDVFVGGIFMGDLPDFTFLLGTGGEMNYGKYSAADMDAALQKARDAFREEEILKAYEELQKYYADNLPIISVAYRNGATLTGARVGGEIGGTEKNMFCDIDKWFIKKDKGE